MSLFIRASFFVVCFSTLYRGCFSLGAPRSLRSGVISFGLVMCFFCELAYSKEPFPAYIWRVNDKEKNEVKQSGMLEGSEQKKAHVASSQMKNGNIPFKSKKTSTLSMMDISSRVITDLSIIYLVSHEKEPRDISLEMDFLKGENPYDASVKKRKIPFTAEMTYTLHLVGPHTQISSYMENLILTICHRKYCITQIVLNYTNISNSLRELYKYTHAYEIVFFRTNLHFSMLDELSRVDNIESLQFKITCNFINFPTLAIPTKKCSGAPRIIMANIKRLEIVDIFPDITEFLFQHAKFPDLDRLMLYSSGMVSLDSLSWMESKHLKSLIIRNQAALQNVSFSILKSFPVLEELNISGNKETPGVAVEYPYKINLLETLSVVSLDYFIYKRITIKSLICPESTGIRFRIFFPMANMKKKSTGIIIEYVAKKMSIKIIIKCHMCSKEILDEVVYPFQKMQVSVLVVHFIKSPGTHNQYDCDLAIRGIQKSYKLLLASGAFMKFSPDAFSVSDIEYLANTFSSFKISRIYFENVFVSNRYANPGYKVETDSSKHIKSSFFINYIAKNKLCDYTVTNIKNFKESINKSIREFLESRKK
ncbi:hypothetical protein NEFER03_1458 [Nematocida sp. LUAm3]|nr:hypothetical protein NEFER03_1458 [Nematocida sp. LUAm3]KAI5174712.1 hypothetical protein NEFER02_0822 [Nematocida sp. LUAm2]KAI5177877.1 hypothetical protein NEFER01_1079 [Nematocida sp. LUAm1]